MIGRIAHSALGAAVLAVLIAGCSASVGGGDGGDGGGGTDAADRADVPGPQGCTLPGGGVCPRGQSCPAGDGCNTCFCMADGRLGCTLLGCVDGGPPDVSPPPDARPTVCDPTRPCPPTDVCRLDPGCSSVGRCEPARDCAPVIEYCACDGVTTFRDTCQPTRPHRSVGRCEGVDGGMTYRYRGALISAQAPGGFAGSGPAVAIDGDGILRVYFNRPSFDPATPPAMSDRSRALTAAQTNDVFERLMRIDATRLPHPPTGTGGECAITLYLRACATCRSQTINYVLGAQVLPEMDPVWQWFEGVLRSDETRVSPRTYCSGF